MKRMTVLTVLAQCMVGHFVNGQTKLYYTQGIGYETNIFKNPDFLVRNGDSLEREDMYQNGVYTYQQLYAARNYSFGQFEGAVKARFSSQLFLNQEDANSLRGSVELPLAHRLGKKSSIQIAPLFSMYRQSGVDLGDAAIRMPLAYTSIMVPVTYKGKFRKTKFETGGFVQLKDYPMSNGGALFYRSAGVLLKTKGKLKIGEHSLKQTTDMRAYYRHYTDIDLVGDPIWNDEELEMEREERIRNRNWAYVQVGHSLKKSFGKGKSLELPMRSSLRLDFSTNRFGYWHNEIGLKGRYQGKLGSISAHMELGYRHFLTLQTADQENLRYIYTSLNFRYEYVVHDKWILVADADLVRRFSNQSSTTSLAFRGYYTAEYMVGVKYRFIRS